MNVSSKIFDVNGFGNDELINTINLATNGHKFYAYKVEAEKGILLYLSQTLCPSDAVVFDSSITISEQYEFVISTLKTIENTVLFENVDDVFDAGNDIVIGWRVYTELENVDNQLWWKHYLIVRPSYVSISLPK